ncbi:MAG: DUF2911 domain-containing protein [Acidobacteriota bacterium]
MRRSVLAVSAAAALFATTAMAQKTTEMHPGKGGSPHVRTEWSVDGANIAIEYGRPALKGRPEAQLMPPGKPWRTGADEATTLRTDKPLKFGALSVPAGAYTLYTIPGASEWQLAISKRTGQWGIPVQTSDDLGRVSMTVGKTSSPVEMLTISIDDTPAGATLRIEWGSTRASVPFTVG